MRMFALISFAAVLGLLGTKSLSALDGGGVSAPTAVSIEAIEVTQTIQDLRDSVPLIAGKSTIARVYLEVSTNDRFRISGKLLLIQSDIGQGVSIDSAEPFVAGDDIPLATRRLKKRGSLNFVLPINLVKTGTFTLQIGNLEGIERPIRCSNCDNFTKTIVVNEGTPFRVRLVGFRYSTKEGKVVEPDAIDFDTVESWIRAAYPVGQLLSSRITIDMPELADGQSCSVVNGRLSALRLSDISGGLSDIRTHYYGLVGDNSGKAFMRGCANSIPQIPDPASVASGPAGAPEFTYPWDKYDTSYAGWYAAHELAHTLGRSHPGICQKVTPTDDKFYPFNSGLIASSNLEYVGWDSTALDYSRMRVIDGGNYHDIMTYCENEWPSAYTYRALRRRLRCELNLFSDTSQIPDDCMESQASAITDLGPEGSIVQEALGGPGPANGPAPTIAVGGSTGAPSQGFDGSLPLAELHQDDGKEVTAKIEEIKVDAIGVVAVVDVEHKEGRILHFVSAEKGKFYSADPAEGSIKVALLDDQGKIIMEGSAPVMVNSEGSSEGLATIVTPLIAGIREIRLFVGGKLVDSRRFGTDYPKISSVKLQVTQQGSEAAAGIPSTNDRLRLSWKANPQIEGLNPVTYTVQRSADSGKTWETVAVGVTGTEVSIDSPVDQRQRPYSYRIISTDGVHTIRTVSDPVVVPLQ